MRTRLLLILLFFVMFLLFLNLKLSHAECILDCVFQAGTKCINNECVNLFSPTPTPTPTPAPINEIRLESLPAASIVGVPVDCTGMDLSKLKIYLTRKTPPGPVSFYSFVLWFEPDFSVTYYSAQKDILNRYVFVQLLPTDTMKPQFTGQDFSFTIWENSAFTDFLKTKTCAELKAGGLYFKYGIMINGEFEGNIFTFR
jgi:hypothetical protein